MERLAAFLDRRRAPQRTALLATLFLVSVGRADVLLSDAIAEFPIPSAVSHPDRITAGPDGNLWFTGKRNKIGRMTTGGAVTTFLIPTSNAYPAGLTTGPDGNIWFTESRGNKIGRMTTAGIVTEFGPVTDPAGITSGPDGNLWFVEFSGNKVGRITTTGVITEFSIPTPVSGPTNITSGPDGNLWFTERDGGKIGRVTPSGAITEFALQDASSLPMGIALGADGNLWFVEEVANRIGKITPAGVITEFPALSLPSYPHNITAGPDGALWFTERGQTNIGRISTSGVVTEFSITMPGWLGDDIAAGPDGSLWFTGFSRFDRIARMTTSGAASEFSISDAGALPQYIASGADGNAWFTETEGNKIGRVTPAGVLTAFPIPTPESFPVGITAGPDGNLWFAEETAPNIGRVKPSGSITEFPLPGGSDRALDITAGSDGAIWFITVGGRIGRITIAGIVTNLFDAPTPNSLLRAITAGPDGNLWYTNQSENRIGRITPSGVITEFPLPVAGSQPWAIAAGGDGAIWFTEISNNKIGRITTSGLISEFPLGFPNRYLQGLTGGPDGNVWFTETANRIGRITPAGIISEFDIPTPLTSPVGIVAAADGNIWFVESEADQIGKAVLDRPLTAAGVDLNVAPGFSFTKTVATFMDADDAALTGSFTASVVWGDGASSSGVVTAGANGGFEVRGSHSYGAPGSYAITVTILDIDTSHDLGGSTAIAKATATVAALAITSSSPLPPGTVGAPYSRTLSASGGTPPYSWNLASGALPAGLTLAPTGLLSGTPTAFGSFTFTVRAADSAGGAVTNPFTLPIASAMIVVNDSSDLLHNPGCAATGTGLCSLRDAITFGNSNPGPDVITFNVPGSGVRTILPTSFLPPLSDAAGVTIDGYTQPGASPNALATGNNAVLLVEIDGSSIPSGYAGMLYAPSPNNTIRGLVLNRYVISDCIALAGNDNVVEGNFLGTDSTGLTAKPCRGAVLVADGTGNRIGGPDPARRNLLTAGSLNVVDLAGSGGSVFQGNYVGTNRHGTLGLGAPFHGIATASDGNQIGGTAPGAGNLISGNGAMLGHGIILASSGNTVAGNLIGTDAAVAAPIPNGQYGIFVIENTANNTIVNNTIAYNGAAGIKVGHFNDALTSGNRISANKIFSNGGLGIDLGNDGVTPNDPCDTDTGANGLQNFPVLTAASRGPGTTRIQGTLDSSANTSYTIEFFTSRACDPSGYGEGEAFLGSTTVTTNGSCGASFDVTLPVVVQGTDRITATATDPAGNTSEFSACVAPASRFYTIAPCRVADTRDPPGPFGGPPLDSSSDRQFVVAGTCGISPTAQAVSFNFAVTGSAAAGYIRVYPGGSALPASATLNYSRGQTRSNNAIIPLGVSGDVRVHVTQGAGAVDLVIDANGYFE